METTTNKIGFKYSGIDNKVAVPEKKEEGATSEVAKVEDAEGGGIIGLPISTTFANLKLKVESLTAFLGSKEFTKLDALIRQDLVMEFRESVALVSESEYKDNIMLAIVRGG
jgi:hypothetical protein